MKRFAILAAALAFAGCQSERPYAPDYPPLRPSIGAPAGAAARTAAVPPAQRTVASTGMGTLAAGMAGNYMDRQEADLRGRLRMSGVGVGRIGDAIVLHLKGDALFAPASDRVSPDARHTLESIAAVLAHYNETLIDVNGYSDTTGSADANLKLSQARAEAVADVLADGGVAAERISPKGFGETDLKIPTGDNVNEPRNRRVEIRIVPRVQG